MTELLQRAQDLAGQLEAWRRHFHRHPELAFCETATARTVSEALEAMGLGVRRGVGRTGVVAELGQGRPVVALRADMDALPIQEENDVPYASCVPGVMHACGHDVHTTWLLGAAVLLTQSPPSRGQVRFLFQPAEETVDEEGQSGAMRMVADGAMVDVEAVFGLHVDARQPLGQLRTRAGAYMAAVDLVQAAVRGVSAHGAYPHQGVDPIAITAQILNALYAIPSRRISPIEPCVVSVGAVHGGTAPNIIPDRVEITGTIRSFSPHVRQRLHEQVRRAFALAETLGGRSDLHIEEGYPVLENDPAMVDLLREEAVRILGQEYVLESDQETGSEDFSLLIRASGKGGVFAWLGAQVEGDKRAHHHPRFDVDERCLPLGAALLAAMAYRYLA